MTELIILLLFPSWGCLYAAQYNDGPQPIAKSKQGAHPSSPVSQKVMRHVYNFALHSILPLAIGHPKVRGLCLAGPFRPLDWKRPTFVVCSHLKCMDDFLGCTGTFPCHKVKHSHHYTTLWQPNWESLSAPTNRSASSWGWASHMKSRWDVKIWSPKCHWQSIEAGELHKIDKPCWSSLFQA